MKRVGAALLTPDRRWRLYLNCGHIVQRPAPAGNPPRPPRRAKCDTCDKTSEGCRDG